MEAVKHGRENGMERWLALNAKYGTGRYITEVMIGFPATLHPGISP
jgi:hypothetical protein